MYEKFPTLSLKDQLKSLIKLWPLFVGATSDRFYQAILRRCAKKKEGKAVDEKRWFLPELPPLADMPALPEDLKRAVDPL